LVKKLAVVGMPGPITLKGLIFTTKKVYRQLLSEPANFIKFEQPFNHTLNLKNYEED
jgi:hypothetical protein